MKPNLHNQAIALRSKYFKKQEQIFKNSLSFSRNEIKYLMSGHATELISMHRIMFAHSIKEVKEQDTWDKAYIYGVVANDQTKGKYVWIYLYYDCSFWKCQDITHACAMINELREYEELDYKLSKAENKLQRMKQKQKALLKPIQKSIAA